MALNKAQIIDQLTNSVINLEDPTSSGYSPIPYAAWVADLNVHAIDGSVIGKFSIGGGYPTELSNWLAERISNPSDPNAIYAGMGPAGDVYIVALNAE